VAPRHEIYSQVDPFTRPRDAQALFEVLVTFIPYVALVVLMLTLAHRGYWPAALAIASIAGLFLVRVFVVFHDCCHGSFFRSRKANRFVGYLGGFLTLTPFESWQQSHAVHHASVGDLDRRGVGDVWTLTVEEYRAAPLMKRLFYRVFRNPFIMFGVGPALLFLAGNRLPEQNASRRERISVHATNAYLVAGLVAGHFTIGLPTLLLTMVPTLVLAGTIGVWLFYVQHQYDDVYWARHGTWDPMKAALEGSSYYKLPAPLQWLTGSIGLHHIHHVQPRIPLYNLQQCQETVPIFQSVPPLTLARSFDTLRLRLFDETSGRMVTWADVRKAAPDALAEGGS